MSKNKKEALVTRTKYQQHKGEQKKKNPSRLTEKERGRRLDTFYNWAIVLLIVAIVLVFVLAFFI